MQCLALFVCVLFFLIQLFSSNLLPHFVHILMNSKSLYLSCLQLKILIILFLYWNFKNATNQTRHHLKATDYKFRRMNKKDCFLNFHIVWHHTFNKFFSWCLSKVHSFVLYAKECPKETDAELLIKCLSSTNSSWIFFNPRPD